MDAAVVPVGGQLGEPPRAEVGDGGNSISRSADGPVLAVLTGMTAATVLSGIEVDPPALSCKGRKSDWLADRVSPRSTATPVGAGSGAMAGVRLCSARSA